MKDLNYIEINKNNLIHNLDIFKNISRNKICAVVKGNAYGHGLAEIVNVLEDKVDYFQVDDYLELLELRKYTNKKAFVFGYIELDKLPELKEKNAIPGLYNKESINAYDGAYHLKIDAYLGRQGVLTHELKQFLDSVDNKNVSGLYTHFSNIEDSSHPNHYKKQIYDFKIAIEILKDYGIKNFEVHTNSTAGALVNNLLPTNITRLGLGLYGMWPSEDLKNRYESKIGHIKPVLKWISHVAQIKLLPKDYPVGYGLTFITDKPMKIAVIPQGYSDGFDRKLSNHGRVIIRNTYCRVLGRVAMNMFVVDVTHLKNVKIEDKVILIGKSEECCISAEEIAIKTGTINYEVTSRLSPNIPRTVV